MREENKIHSLSQTLRVRRHLDYYIKTIITQRPPSQNASTDLLQIKFILTHESTPMVFIVEESRTSLTEWQFYLDPANSVTDFKDTFAAKVFIYCFGALLTRVALLLNGITDKLLCFITTVVTCYFIFICFCFHLVQQLTLKQKRRMNIKREEILVY